MSENTKKQHLWNCEVCGKGTNNSVWIKGRADEKTALCSKDYKKWLEIKSEYYNKAVAEFCKDLKK